MESKKIKKTVPKSYEKKNEKIEERLKDDSTTEVLAKAIKSILNTESYKNKMN